MRQTVQEIFTINEQAKIFKKERQKFGQKFAKIPEKFVKNKFLLLDTTCN